MDGQNSLPTDITPETIIAWARKAVVGRLRLHMVATDPSHVDREMAFTGMSVALEEAIEEVLAVSRALADQKAEAVKDKARLMEENHRLRAELQSELRSYELSRGGTRPPDEGAAGED